MEYSLHARVCIHLRDRLKPPRNRGFFSVQAYIKAVIIGDKRNHAGQLQVHM